jgi:hypothetical protein
MTIMYTIIHRLLKYLFLAVVTLFFLYSLAGNSIASESAQNPTKTQKQNTVKVSDVNSLFKAIDTNTIIILSPGDYHLDQVDTGIINDNCNWAWVLLDEIYYDEKNNDDKTLLISNIKNLTIKTTSKKGKPVRILTNRRDATVLAFKNCENINIDGLVVGHDVVKYLEPGDPYVSYCSGEVTEFFDCKNVCISNSVLFGSGTRGFMAHRCNDFKLFNSIIKECSWGAFGIFDSENILISKSKIYKNGYRVLIEITSSSNITISNTSFTGNFKCDEYSGEPVILTQTYNTKIKSITLKDNDFPADYFYIPLKNEN